MLVLMAIVCNKLAGLLSLGPTRAYPAAGSATATLLARACCAGPREQRAEDDGGSRP